MGLRGSVRWSEASRRMEAAVDNEQGLRVQGVHAENGRISACVVHTLVVVVIVIITVRARAPCSRQR